MQKQRLFIWQTRALDSSQHTSFRIKILKFAKSVEAKRGQRTLTLAYHYVNSWQYEHIWNVRLQRFCTPVYRIYVFGILRCSYYCVCRLLCTSYIMERATHRHAGVLFATAVVAVAILLMTQGTAAWPSFFTQSVFENYFPDRIQAFYTYQALQTAAQIYPDFGNANDLDSQKREVAAFCANVKHESGGKCPTSIHLSIYLCISVTLQPVFLYAIIGWPIYLYP